jgi:N-methylhydantoinase A
VDVRYVGQSFEITVPFAPGFRDEFDRRHEQLYGYANPHRAAEVVNVRVRGAGVTAKPALPRAGRAPARPAVADRVRPACFAGRSLETAVYRADSFEAGMHGTGPAILAGAQATMVVPPGFDFRVDETFSVIATRKARRARR